MRVLATVSVLTHDITVAITEATVWKPFVKAVYRLSDGRIDLPVWAWREIQRPARELAIDSPIMYLTGLGGLTPSYVEMVRDNSNRIIDRINDEIAVAGRPERHLKAV